MSCHERGVWNTDYGTLRAGNGGLVTTALKTLEMRPDVLMSGHEAASPCSSRGDLPSRRDASQRKSKFDGISWKLPGVSYRVNAL